MADDFIVCYESWITRFFKT